MARRRSEDEFKLLSVDLIVRLPVNSISLLGGRPMVGLQTLDLAIGVRVPASQPIFSHPHYQKNCCSLLWRSAVSA